MKRAVATALSFLVILCSVFAQPGYEPSEDNVKSREEFNDMRFGIFIHWGIYSMLGAGEWVQEINHLDYREYARLASGFYPSKFDADEWVRAFKSSGAGYMTITSRHHDGFSMFDTGASDFNVVSSTPFGRDVIGELARACREQDFRLHLYYSLVDWGREDYWPLGTTGKLAGRPEGGDWNSYLDFMSRQLEELLVKYDPAAIWLDGVWDKDGTDEQVAQTWNLYGMYSLIHSLKPSCLVGNNHHKKIFPGEDIQIFERDVPGENKAGYSAGVEVSAFVPLETCQTMNYDWGYKITDIHYKTPEYLVRYLVRTAGKGANLLLNIGPRPDGSIPDKALECLEFMGSWLKEYGWSVYGTDAGYISEQDWGVSTQKGNQLYLHVLEPEKVADGLCVDIPEGNSVRSVVFRGTPVKYSARGRKLSLYVPASDPVDNIVVVTFRKPLLSRVGR